MTDEQLAKILEEARWVIMMFDQLNTSYTVERIGSRGILLKEVVDDLRVAMKEASLDLIPSGGEWRGGYTNP